MEEKLQRLEKDFEATGLALQQDIQCCKTLYSEFVKQILDASEFLSLDVVQGNLELPKFKWLEQSLQIRSEIEFVNENNGSKFSPQCQEPREPSERVDLGPTFTPTFTPANNVDSDSEYESVIMSDKGIQTTPIYRNRNSLNKRNLLLLLQKSNILKKGDSFMKDKSYDADISQAVTELNNSNSPSSSNDLTVYPNSTYDTISPSVTTDAVFSDTSKAESDVEDNVVDSTTDGSVFMETEVFKRVHTRRHSMVTLMLPKKDSLGQLTEGDGVTTDDSVFDMSKSNQKNDLSVYQSISLMANSNNSLGLDVSDIRQLSSMSPLVIQSTKQGDATSEVELSDVEVSLADYGSNRSVDEPCMQKEIDGVEEAESSKQDTKVDLESDQIKEVDNAEEPEVVDVLEEKENSVFEDDQIVDKMGDISSPRKDSIATTELFPDAFHEDEVATVDDNQLEHDTAESSDEVECKEAEKQSNEKCPKQTAIKDSKPAKLRVQRRRRRGPPLNMPRNWKVKRRDFISLFTATKSRNTVSRKMVDVENTFRKEPVSAKLQQIRETSLYKSVLKGEKVCNRGPAWKKRSPLFLSKDERLHDDPVKKGQDDDSNGFAVLERIIWTPETTKKASSKEITEVNDKIIQDGSLIVANESIDRIDKGKSLGSLAETANQDEALISIKVKPKSRRRNPSTVDVALEITMQNNRSDEESKESDAKKQETVNVKLKCGRARRNASLEKKQSLDITNGDCSVFKTIELPAKSQTHGNNDNGSDAHCGDILKKRGKRRGAVAKLDDVSSNESIVSENRIDTSLMGSEAKIGKARKKSDSVSDLKCSVDSNGTAAIRRATRSMRKGANKSTMKPKAAAKRPKRARGVKKQNVKSDDYQMSGDQENIEKINCAEGIQANVKDEGVKDDGVKDGDVKDGDVKDGDVKDGDAEKGNGLSPRIQAEITDEDVSILNKHQEHPCIEDDEEENDAFKRPKRRRRKPDFYSSLNSSVSDSSNRKNQKMESGKKKETKPVTQDGLKKDEKLTENESFPSSQRGKGRKSQRRRKCKDSKKNGDALENCSKADFDAEISDISAKNLLVYKEVSSETVVESTNNCCKDGPAKTVNLKRDRKSIISAAPKLVIIDEVEESSENLQLTGPKYAELDENTEEKANVETIDQNTEKDASVCRRRKSRPRRGPKSSTKRGRKGMPPDVKVEESDTKMDDDREVGAEGEVNQSSLQSTDDAASKTISNGQNNEEGKEASEEPDKNTSNETEDDNSKDAKKNSEDLFPETRSGELRDTGLRSRARRSAKSLSKGGKLDSQKGKDAKEKDSIENNIAETSLHETDVETGGNVKTLNTPDIRRSTRKAKKTLAMQQEKENEFAVPEVRPKSAVKKKSLAKRPVDAEKANDVPEKKKRPLFSKKNSSMMSLNFSVMQDTTALNATKNTTMNTNSIVMPQTLSNFLRSFVAPKIKKKPS